MIRLYTCVHTSGNPNYPLDNITANTSVPSILCFLYMAESVFSSLVREKAMTCSDYTIQVFLDTVSGTTSKQYCHNELIHELQQKTLLDVIL